MHCQKRREHGDFGKYNTNRLVECGAKVQKNERFPVTLCIAKQVCRFACAVDSVYDVCIPVLQCELNARWQAKCTQMPTMLITKTLRNMDVTPRTYSDKLIADAEQMAQLMISEEVFEQARIKSKKINKNSN
mmetsp:Transcript_93784/g.136959  ORF Transcript_93784/g.136959 Transcript_93784/m.136959 type:complete len:132 (-) Transcript_93784:85-480(-)